MAADTGGTDRERDLDRGAQAGPAQAGSPGEVGPATQAGQAGGAEKREATTAAGPRPISDAEAAQMGPLGAQTGGPQAGGGEAGGSRGGVTSPAATGEGSTAIGQERSRDLIDRDNVGGRDEDRGGPEGTGTGSTPIIR